MYPKWRRRCNQCQNRSKALYRWWKKFLMAFRIGFAEEVGVGRNSERERISFNAVRTCAGPGVCAEQAALRRAQKTNTKLGKSRFDTVRRLKGWNPKKLCFIDAPLQHKAAAPEGAHRGPLAECGSPHRALQQQ